MTLQDLSDAWNDLRNAALGRGVRPLVSQPLADRVAAEYSAWRAFYEQSGTTDDLVPSMQQWSWVERYRDVLAAVKAEGRSPTLVLPITVAERGRDAITTGLGIGSGVLLVAAAVVVAPLFVGLLRKRGRA